MTHLFDHLHPYENIIWDWNGTLLNDVEYAVGKINSLLAPRQLPTLDVQSYRERFCFPIRKYYDTLGFNFESETFEQVAFEFVDSFMRDYKSCELFPESRHWLEHVKSSGRSQSILSATDQDSLNQMMEHYGLLPLLDHIYGIGDKFAATKVHRGKELMEKTNMEPRKTLLIGDTDHDLEVGQAMGVDVLLVTHGHQCVKKLQSLHHFTYSPHRTPTSRGK
ncbi:MAG: HAD hydrolase-like protein [Bdellovibrionales bacterium]|nr:HAD hydrolase-like protein [Bdellovibrionales bacterium]